MTESGAERVIIAVFADPDRAKGAVERLIAQDYPMDMISLLGPAHGWGDDPLGIYYHTLGERMRGWGRLGAFWGGLWGLLAGAAGLFVIPGLGAVFAAGPVVEALAGAAVAAAATGGAMAGAGALSHLAVALHTVGIPEARLAALHESIAGGRHVLVLRCRGAGECARYRQAVANTAPDELEEYPFKTLLPVHGQGGT